MYKNYFIHIFESTLLGFIKKTMIFFFKKNLNFGLFSVKLMVYYQNKQPHTGFYLEDLYIMKNRNTILALAK